MINIFSWNVNGIRAVNSKGLLLSFIERYQPDILCLQEIKARREQVELNLSTAYQQFWFSAEKPGYAGTAIFTKPRPLQTVNGLPADLIKRFKLNRDNYGDPNTEGRVLTVEYPLFYLVTVYTPNAKDDLSRLNLRFKYWDPAFLAYCQVLEKTKPVVFCGDLNVAHTELDLANPGPNRGKKGFTDEERAGFNAFIQNGFIDTFRLFTKEGGNYTWWSHFARARERNVGWRIDYVLVSSGLKDKVKNATIYPEVIGSDHCPVSVSLDLK